MANYKIVFVGEGEERTVCFRCKSCCETAALEVSFDTYNRPYYRSFRTAGTCIHCDGTGFDPRGGICLKCSGTAVCPECHGKAVRYWHELTDEDRAALGKRVEQLSGVSVNDSTMTGFYRDY